MVFFASRVNTITTACKEHWLSVALKVIVSTLVLPNIAEKFFHMKIASALNGSVFYRTDHQK